MYQIKQLEWTGVDPLLASTSLGIFQILPTELEIGFTVQEITPACSINQSGYFMNIDAAKKWSQERYEQQVKKLLHVPQQEVLT